MKTQDFKSTITSVKLAENLEKQFGVTVNVEDYDRERLEDIRNKLRTKIFQQEGSAKFNDLLTNETYQKNKAMLELLNTRIKEMLGEQMKQLRDKMDQLTESKKSKPDFLDLDKDGNKKEPMKKAAKDAKVKEAIKKDKKELEGNAFGAAEQAAVKSGKSEFKVGDKTYKVKEAMGKKCCCSSKGEDKCPVHGMKEGFPTVDSARAEHEKTKTTGKFDKKEVKPGVTQYTRKSNTFTDGGDDSDVKTAKKKAKGVKEGMKHAKDCDCKECMGMYERDEGKHNNGTTTGFKAVAKKAAKEYGSKAAGERVAGAVRNKMKKAGQLEESQFKHNVRFVNESIGFLLQEDEEAKAKTITAAGDIVNDFTGWMQRIGQYQTKAIIELADSIRADFGAAESEAFKQKVSPALSASLEMLTQQREILSNAVAELAGEAVPDAPMGMEPDAGMDADIGLDTAAPDEMNPEPAGDEFAASDAAAGGDETAGRGLRESRQQRRVQKLAEQHSILSKLAQ
jgi:hypothetical protein